MLFLTLAHAWEGYYACARVKNNISGCTKLLHVCACVRACVCVSVCVYVYVFVHVCVHVHVCVFLFHFSSRAVAAIESEIEYVNKYHVCLEHLKKPTGSVFIGDGT